MNTISKDSRHHLSGRWNKPFTIHCFDCLKTFRLKSEVMDASFIQQLLINAKNLIYFSLSLFQLNRFNRTLEIFIRVRFWSTVSKCGTQRAVSLHMPNLIFSQYMINTFFRYIHSVINLILIRSSIIDLLEIESIFDRLKSRLKFF